MADPQQFWSRDDEDSAAASGLSREQLRECGARFGVRFPDSYVELFAVQNGGQVRDEDLYLFPLPTSETPADFGIVSTVEQIIQDDEFARELVEDELGDPQLVLLIAGDDGHTYHALDFNVNGPQGEPRVVWLNFECTDCDEVSQSFAGLVEELTRADDTCAVDMREILRLQVIAHVTIDYEYEDGEREHVDQHLCDAGDALVLFVDENGPDGHELSRVEITRPLNADACVITSRRPKPNQTFMLMLEPEDDEEILWTTSRETGDGRWKNSTTRGVPIYAEFESTDKSRLQELRLQLLGGEVSERAAAEEEWHERVEEMSEEEMEAAFPHLMLQMMGEMDRLVSDLDPNDAPDEMKNMMKQMQQLKAKMKADLEQHAAGSDAPDPELLDLLKQMMPKPEDFE
jgi:SMI1 / KNR4 family (SUKH-1)